MNTATQEAQDSTNGTITHRVKRVIAQQLGVSELDVKPDSNFVNDLGADSLDGVELLMAIEDEFEFEISDEDGEQLTTPQAYIDFIAKNKPELAK
jgi:acyl carrier protein